MDIIAVPWVENPKPHKDVIEAILDIVGFNQVAPSKIIADAEQKPHGRLAYAIPTGSSSYVDISFTPTI
jgi:hypothetical protein